MLTTQEFRINKALFKQFEDITPIKCFCNGMPHIASKITIESVKDNLLDYVLFKYTLLNADDVFAGDGHFELSGADYPLWDSSADGAYAIVCTALGIELIKGE